MSKRISLVLGGGAAKGLSCIGVIEVLEENNIPIKRIIGCSSGALIGAAYSAGILPKVKDFFLSLTKPSQFKLFFSLPSKLSVVSCKKMDSLVKGYFENLKLEKLPLPVFPVAYNITKNKKVVFNKGSVYDAVRASMAAPGFIKPHTIKNDLFVDGAVIDIVPVDVATKFKEKIVSVNLEHYGPSYERLSLLSLMDKSIHIKTKELARINEQSADIKIHPNVPFKHFQYYKTKEIIGIGRKETKKHIEKIKKLL